MNLEYFNLKENPFRDTLDERFYFPTPTHEKAFASIIHCITNHEPAGLIVGESGTGKSLICRKILSHYTNAEEYSIALLLVNPNMPKTSALKEILREFKIEFTQKNPTTSELIDIFHEFIIKKYVSGVRCILLIDEAHFLSVEALHLMRTFTNLETPREKLLTCIFIAEERFIKRLQYPTYASLKGRIKMKTRIDPLSKEETRQYIIHRLRTAGAYNSIFKEETYPLIYNYSRGVCRNINKIAGQALFNAQFTNKKIIDEEILQEAINDLKGVI